MVSQKREAGEKHIFDRNEAFSQLKRALKSVKSFSTATIGSVLKRIPSEPGVLILLLQLPHELSIRISDDNHRLDDNYHHVKFPYDNGSDRDSDLKSSGGR